MSAGRSSSRIDCEATTEVGFGFTPIVLLCALKPLFIMLLRRSNARLRISVMGLFWRFFLRRVDLIASGGFVLAPFSP
jgi:hypothetical protein